MSLLEVRNLSHSFGDKELYQNQSFDLNKGDHMGIVGQNGTGKSTLIKLLIGVLSPNDGSMTWQRGIEIGYIDQYADIDGARPIGDYMRSAFDALYQLEAQLQSLYHEMASSTDERIYNRAARYQELLEKRNFYGIDTEVARVATGLGISALGMDRPLSTLSGGQRTKVILAKLLLAQPDVLLLDEPTNFLDKEHIDWLSEYLSAFEGSFAIVSHDFEFLDRVTNCILDIEHQSIKKYHGRYADFVRQKEHLREDYVRQYHAQQRQVEKLEDYIARNKARASTARMAKGRQKQLDKIERLAPPSVAPTPNIHFSPVAPVASRALTVDNLLVGYSFPLLPKLRFSVDGRQKIAITGFNGIGKSTLLKTLVGAIPSLGGRFDFALGAKIRYFEQDMRWRDGERTPLQILVDAYPSLPPKKARQALSHVGLRAEHAMRPIRSLSGGEQNKVKLCLMMMVPGNLLILDEPTNHLDAETKQALKDAIIEFDGCVLLVCHEAAFYKDWADRVLDIEKFLR